MLIFNLILFFSRRHFSENHPWKNKYFTLKELVDENRPGEKASGIFLWISFLIIIVSFSLSLIYLIEWMT